MKSFLIVGLAVFLCALASVAAGSPVDNLTPGQNVRYQNLTAQLRCVVCQNQNIANSSAPMAADLRAIVARQVRAGRSNRQIKDYMVERYGDFILYDPPFNYKTLVLWLGPLVLLLCGLLLVFGLVRRRGGIVAGRKTAPLDRRRLDDLLSESDSDDTKDHSSRVN